MDITDKVFLTKRQAVLEDFLRRCLDHPIIRQDKGSNVSNATGTHSVHPTMHAPNFRNGLVTFSVSSFAVLGFAVFLTQQEWREELTVKAPTGELHAFLGSEWTAAIKSLTASRGPTPVPM